MVYRCGLVKGYFVGGDTMELARRYLEDLQDMLCDEVAHDLEHDARFKTKREMQQYNCGIAKAMRLVNAFLDCNEFHSPIFNQFRDMK